MTISYLYGFNRERHIDGLLSEPSWELAKNINSLILQSGIKIDLNFILFFNDFVNRTNISSINNSLFALFGFDFLLFFFRFKSIFRVVIYCIYRKISQRELLYHFDRWKIWFQSSSARSTLHLPSSLNFPLYQSVSISLLELWHIANANLES